MTTVFVISEISSMKGIIPLYYVCDHDLAFKLVELLNEDRYDRCDNISYFFTKVVMPKRTKFNCIKDCQVIIKRVKLSDNKHSIYDVADLKQFENEHDILEHIKFKNEASIMQSYYEYTYKPCKNYHEYCKSIDQQPLQ